MGERAATRFLLLKLYAEAAETARYALLGVVSGCRGRLADACGVFR
jgi:hypothetical protein